MHYAIGKEKKKHNLKSHLETIDLIVFILLFLRFKLISLYFSEDFTTYLLHMT